MPCQVVGDQIKWELRGLSFIFVQEVCSKPSDQQWAWCQIHTQCQIHWISGLVSILLDFLICFRRTGDVLHSNIPIIFRFFIIGVGNTSRNMGTIKEACPKRFTASLYLVMWALLMGLLASLQRWCFYCTSYWDYRESQQFSIFLVLKHKCESL